MAFETIIDSVENRRKTLTVHVPPDDTPLVEEVAEYFDSQNVRVVRGDADGGRSRVVLSDGGRELASVDLGALSELVGPGEGLRSLGEKVAYAPLLRHMDNTTFTSYDREQMLHASREIEDRAWRVAEGTIYAGFQRLSVFEPCRDVYEKLGEAGVEPHVYGVPDVSVDPGTFTIHGVDDEAIAQTWFVAFDGPPAQKSALVAVEREDGYFGVWTYDPDTVDSAVDAAVRFKPS
jgi:DICT domain-containing protein